MHLSGKPTFKSLQTAAHGGTSLKIQFRSFLVVPELRGSMTSVPLQSWMQQLPSHAKGRSICELALPGAHNAGAREVKCISPLVKTGGYLNDIARSGVANAIARPVAGAVALCQAVGIGQLLQDGVRLLDLRLGRHDGELYMCHTVICNQTFCGVLEEVAQFLREQPGEVVVLLVKRDFHHREYFDTEDRSRCC